MIRGHRLIAAGRVLLAGGAVLSLAGVGLLVGATTPAGASADSAAAPISASQLTLSWAEAHGAAVSDEPGDPVSEGEATPQDASSPEPSDAPTSTPATTGDTAPTTTPTPPTEEIDPGGQAAAEQPSVAGDSDSISPPVGDPDFDGLSVTVSQTDNLVNQGIRISWTGGRPTSQGEFADNYLSIMQCWGDDEDGPTPQQCQWGGTNPTIGGLMGQRAGGRGLQEGEDPAQVYSTAIRIPPPRDRPNQRSFAFPFQSVRSSTAVFDPREYFTSATTNEVSAARTGADGTGSVAFEVQTSLEAPHLGCGATLSDGSGRSCWLVIVPRGSKNLNGALAATATTAGRVTGSPLSASAWKNRMVIPLDFQPVTSPCPIGAAERRVVGSEIIADAFTSWQPALCANGPTYGFSQLGDGEARTQILSGVDGGSKLAFVSAEADTGLVGDATMRYAQVANSSVVVAFNIDYSVSGNSTAAGKNGTPVTNLVLNARIVAKLLTQSYRTDIPDGGVADGLAGNPASLVQDPEFVALNPEFAGWSTVKPEGLMVALGSSDMNALVWSWLRADPLANDFLLGNPDDWGMKLNPYYKTLSLATSVTDSFPKADLTTNQVLPAPPPGFGTLDMRPYMNDAHEGALRTLRGDANVKVVWDEQRLPPAYIASGPQLPGQRFTLALVDAASAQRYGLPTAKLVNAAGQVVGSSPTSVSAALAAATPSTTTGVRPMSPEARVVGAYPLSMPVYAAINVCEASKSELADYEALIEYATGPGQVTGDGKGQLPRGYVPLSEADLKTSAAVVKALKKGISCTTPAEEPFPDFDDSGYGDFPTDSGGGGETPPATDPEESKRYEATDPALTPARLGVFGALALGIPCMIAGPILSARGRRLALGEEPE